MQDSDGGDARDQVGRPTRRDVLGLSERRLSNEDIDAVEPKLKAPCLSGLAPGRDLLFLSLV